jgi:hypothetical protein
MGGWAIAPVHFMGSNHTCALVLWFPLVSGDFGKRVSAFIDDNYDNLLTSPSPPLTKAPSGEGRSAAVTSTKFLFRMKLI